jgi:hypothetical protein
MINNFLNIVQWIIHNTKKSKTLQKQIKNLPIWYFFHKILTFWTLIISKRLIFTTFKIKLTKKIHFSTISTKTIQIKGFIIKLKNVPQDNQDNLLHKIIKLIEIH